MTNYRISEDAKGDLRGVQAKCLWLGQHLLSCCGWHDRNHEDFGSARCQRVAVAATELAHLRFSTLRPSTTFLRFFTGATVSGLDVRSFQPQRRILGYAFKTLD